MKPFWKKDPNNEFVDKWTSQIKAGEDYRKRFSTYEKWTEYRKMYRGQWPNGIIPLNKIYAYGRMLVPRIYFNAPRVVVTASHPEMALHAKTVEAIDNMLIREVFLKTTLKKSITNTYLSGIGPIKLGFDSEFGYIPKQAGGAGGETVTQVSEKDGTNIEYNVGIKPGMPWAQSVMPENLVVPYGATDPESLPWIANYILRPLADVQKDSKYNAEARKKLKGTRLPTGGARNIFKPNLFGDKQIDYAELWEVRDAQTKMIYVFCENEILLSVKDELQIEGLPYEFMMFNPDPEYFWPIPDAHMLQPQQKELNDITTQESRHRAIALIKFLYGKDKISKVELNKFLSGDIGVAVEVDADNILSAVQTLQPHIPPELAAAAMEVIQYMKETIGFSVNDLSEYKGGTPPTATETMTVSGSSEMRITERRDIAADVLVRIIRKFNQYIFKFWTGDKVIDVVGPDGGLSWVIYTGSKLEGEYNLSIDIDTGIPITRALKYQMTNDLFAKFNGDMMMNQVLLRQMVLDNYHQVDPRSGQLINIPPELDPSIEANMRQPNPAGTSGNTGGGRKGSSKDNPEEFESLANKFNSSKGAKQ